jgi:hypothetical protein
MVPTVELPPTAPFTSQLTAVLEVPETVALNCCDWVACTVALVGVIETDTEGGGAVTVTVALAETAGCTMLCAVTVTGPEGADVGVV